MMLGGTFIWLIVGVVLFFLFSRNEGMAGCSCGRSTREPRPPKRRYPYREKDAAPHNYAPPHGETIDLKKEDYHVH